MPYYRPGHRQLRSALIILRAAELSVNTSWTTCRKRWAAARLGIVGALNSAIQNQRQKGFEETLKSNPKIAIANVVDGQNVQDKAMTAAENLITGNPDLTAIYATGEPALLGAIAAVENRGGRRILKSLAGI